MSDLITVLIADDHAIVRRGLVELVGSEPDMEVVGQASDGFQAVDLTRQLQPRVLLLDIVMPNKSGLEALRDITALDLATHILVLSSFSDGGKVGPALQGGAAGYTLKDASPEDLLLAIRAVAAGETYLHPSVKSKVERLKTAETAGDTITLSQRELDVLRLVAQGKTNQEIAETLYISNRTVGNHIGKILNKLDLENRTQATLYALSHNLVDFKNYEPG